MLSFVIEKGPEQGRVIRINREVVIGRGPSPDVRIQHPAISRRHARVGEISAHGCKLFDLGSDNGTYVNGQRVRQSVDLHHGDVVALGVDIVEMRVQFEGGTGAGPVLRYQEEEAPAPLQRVATAGAIDSLGMEQRLKVLYEVGEALSQTLEERPLLEKILDRVFAAFPRADRGFILVRTAGEDLELRAARTRQGSVEEMGVSRTVVKEALESRAAVLSADAAGDVRYAQSGTIAALNLRSLVCVPMIAQDKAWGVLQLDTNDPFRPFQKEDVPLLVAIASQAALALAGARMHARLLEQERIEQDMALASRIQSQFLPRHPPRVKGWEFADKYDSALEIGGDYYGFLDLGDRRVGIAIGDVCGKGVPAALYMARLSSEVRYQAVGHTRPSQILARVNKTLCRDLSEDMFVTLLVIAVEPTTGACEASSAGHLPPMIRRANGHVDVIDVSGSPPAGLDGDVEFGTQHFQLEPGDVAVLYTDGVTEAMGPGLVQFDDDRLIEAMSKAEGTPEGVLNAISGAVTEFVGDEVQNDDRAIVCFGRGRPPGDDVPAWAVATAKTPGVGR